jgi:hypothetical protein
MKSYLQALENNEAILLMYLADELAQQDRSEVEQMLASDAGLRGDLEILRQTQQLAYDALETLDAATRPAVPPIVALGQVSQMIHAWAEQKRRPADVVVVAPRPLPWRRISFSAAAALLVGYYIWAVYHPVLTHEENPVAPYITDEANPFNPDDISPLPPARDLSAQEKLALLSNSLADSASDETSNLHVAEVAAVIPVDGSDQNAMGEP